MTVLGASLHSLQQDFASWLVTADEAAAMRLGRADGLAIYQNNYRVSLMTSLEAGFAQVHSWLGDEAFARAAAHFIDAYPPNGWTLDAYGADFATTLASLYPQDPEVADLARIDWAVGQAFVGGNADPAGADVLTEVDWDVARIALVPSLLMVEVGSNADAIWLALAGEGEVPAPCALPERATLFVWRQGFESVMRRAEPAEVRIAECSRDGFTFAQCCEDLARDMGEEAAVEQAGGVLGQWIAEGLVAGLS